MAGHQFGGTWTEVKLAHLKSYLEAYRTILRKYPYFNTWYVDAFAGTGARVASSQPLPQSIFREVYADEETVQYLDGSARIALGLPAPFDNYLFIDESQRHLAELDDTVQRDFPHMRDRCILQPGDANTLLKDWCRERNWSRERTVVFLDPYGMQVEWNTVELLAQTKAVDLWYLLSTGYRSPATSYAHRRDGGSLKKRLDALFGTPEWRTMFYEVTTMTGLFGDFEMQRRTATAEQIRNFCRRGSLSDSPALLMALYWRIPATVHCICYVSPLPMSAEPSLQLRLRRRF